MQDVNDKMRLAQVGGAVLMLLAGLAGAIFAGDPSSKFVGVALAAAAVVLLVLMKKGTGRAD